MPLDHLGWTADAPARGKTDPKAKFSYSRRAEAQYARALSQVARQIGMIVRGMIDPQQPAPEDVRKLRAVLARYGEIIRPWAAAVTARMHAEALKRDEQTWIKVGQQMGRALAQEVRHAPTGIAMQKVLAEQVDLITSLPREAGERVHEMALKAYETAQRAPELEAEIQGYLAEAHPDATERWVRNRAKLIARTETARTSSVLTQVRAEHIGSDGYIWRTAGDWKVRETHKQLAGTFHKWSDPPVSEVTGQRSHPGQIFNCRCWSEVVIPDRF
jgi:SPP1 gp7 family putative phage head morphogenesis protein